MINQVLRIGSQIEADTLSDPESLGKRDVGLEIWRRKEKVTAGIPD